MSTSTSTVGLLSCTVHPTVGTSCATNHTHWAYSSRCFWPSRAQPLPLHNRKYDARAHSDPWQTARSIRDHDGTRVDSVDDDEAGAGGQAAEASLRFLREGRRREPGVAAGRERAECADLANPSSFGGRTNRALGSSRRGLSSFATAVVVVVAVRTRRSSCDRSPPAPDNDSRARAARWSRLHSEVSSQVEPEPTSRSIVGMRN